MPTPKPDEIPVLKGQLTIEDALPPKRIQRKRTKGWRMPPNTVSVCRPGKWGNPFTIGGINWIPVDDSGVWSKEPHEPLTREQAVKCFEHAMRFSLGYDPDYLAELAGKNLACWCKPGDACHADVLLELANAGAVS